MNQSARPKLSICISTFNRAALIGATLESIIGQLTDSCEIVVLDGASSDDTEDVVTRYTRSFDRLYYIRQQTNNGVDRDFDRAVELARGEYCWLMSDDDLLKAGAVAATLAALRKDPSLVIVNSEIRDNSMSRVVKPRFHEVDADHEYGPDEMDRLFAETGGYLVFIGCIVIKREIWLARDRRRYYGSLFIHVGVIFQEHLPMQTLVISEPLISVRQGSTNTVWPNLFEIFMIKWPDVVWSLAISESAKHKVCSLNPWRSPGRLLIYRAIGCYSLHEMRRWIAPRVHSRTELLVPAFVAGIPGALANTLCVIYYSVIGRHELLPDLRNSPFYVGKWRAFRRVSRFRRAAASGRQAG